MAQITEDYVSFETAKLLKEKGFDEPCYAYWHEDENRLIISQSMYAIQNITNPCFFGPAAPTLQMAMKWLREVHNIHFLLSPFFTKEGNVVYSINVLDKEMVGSLYDNLNENTYEEACDAAVKYCLTELI